MNGGTPLETRPCMAGSNPILIAQGIHVNIQIICFGSRGLWFQVSLPGFGERGGECLFHSPEGSCNMTRFMHGTLKIKIIITRLSLKL